MKTPRLYKFQGLWYCRKLTGAVGLGYTKEDAYREWVARNVR